VRKTGGRAPDEFDVDIDIRPHLKKLADRGPGASKFQQLDGIDS
jgi:hypothetical protein